MEDFLLPGEDPATLRRSEVEHWIAVYTEFLNGNRRILTLMTNRGNDNEAEFLERHIRQLERRLSFWTRRRRSAGRPAPLGDELALAGDFPGED